MKFNKHQWIAILATLAFVLVFYFGCETKDPKIKLVEKSRVASFENTSFENIRKRTFDSLDASTRSYFDGLQMQMHDTYDDSSKIEGLKLISGFWYNQKEYALAGETAEQISTLENTAFSWAITGTTYLAGIKRGKTDVRRTFNRSKAVNAFEQAISLEPNNEKHKVNLALCYVELPPEDTPMKGIMMLLDLNKQYPESTSVLFQLARLGLQTNQFEKVIGRLNKILEIDPTSVRAHCMLADVLIKTNKEAEAKSHIDICRSSKK